MRKILVVLSFVSSLVLFGAPAGAAGLSVGAGVSTLGYGVNVGAEINSFLVIRLNGNFGNFPVPDFGLLEGTSGGIDYDIEAQMMTIGLLADLHPLGLSPIGSGLVLTGGIYYSKNEFELTATPAGTVDIGGVPFAGGTIIASMTFDTEYAPYVGLGYDGAFHTILPVSFFITGGVLFQGSPNVSLTTTDATFNATFAAQIDDEARQIEDDVSSFEYYPVFAIGISIAF